ncbi:TonB family protein [Sphingobium sp.]|uniref:TonB family protein n=1 Tax=Sphingobium sp. TaxID=1912891 RepID=UPI0026313B34|nr:TonB family protein [Sphingobium sp.]
MAMQTMSGNGESRYGAARKSPLGLGGTVAVHAIVIGAFLLIPKEVMEVIANKPFIGTNIPLSPPPEPVVEKKADPKIQTRSQPSPRPTATEPVIPLPSDDPVITGSPQSGAGADPVPTIPLPPIDPPHTPVLTDPSIDPRAMGAFQPDYPGTMIRQGVEGTVTVRVTISPEGRVAAIEKISATDESFWIATQRHAMRKWRFRPATRDGVAIISTKVLTVRFTLTDR